MSFLRNTQIEWKKTDLGQIILPLKKLIEALHFKPLRLAVRDHGIKKKYRQGTLSGMCNRAPPLEWSRYATANVVMKTLRNKEPQILHSIITETLYTERRKPLNGKFYDNSHGKIGKQRLCNRIHEWNPLRMAFIEYHGQRNQDYVEGKFVRILQSVSGSKAVTLGCQSIISST